MIDLHLHLDGSLSEDDFRYLASLHGVDLGKKFPDCIHVSDNCQSLEEYLEKFDLPLKLLQDPVSIGYAVKSLVNRLYSMGYIYAEIRFAPQLHTKEGMSQNDAVISALAGLKSALQDKPDFDANLILCCMRQAPMKVNLETINVAAKFKNDKVVAVDLAGPEAVHTGDYYFSLFNQAHKLGLRVIIHAGEACGGDEVIRCIDYLNPSRIGHGVHLDINFDNVKKILNKRICFEFCPTSNTQTKSLSGYDKVPLSDFLRYGINISINSDNMTVSNTNVLKEFKYLYKQFRLLPHEVKHLLTNAIDAAFVPIEEKMVLKKRLEEKFPAFYQEIIRP